MVECDWAYDIEGEVEQSVALIVEVVVDATDGTALCVSIAVLVEHVAIECLDICLARAERQHIRWIGETLVAELHEDDKSPFLACNHTGACTYLLHRLAAHLCIQSLYIVKRCSKALFMILTLVTRVSQHVRGDKMSAADMGIVITSVVRQYGNAIVSDGIMEMFVTYQLQSDGCAVGLSHGAPHRHGRNGKK